MHWHIVSVVRVSVHAFLPAELMLLLETGRKLAHIASYQMVFDPIEFGLVSRLAQKMIYCYMMEEFKFIKARTICLGKHERFSVGKS